VLVSTADTASSVPPPPPNPGDADIKASKVDATAKAAKVGELTNQLAQAQSRLQQLADDVELTMEHANKALVDLRAAQDAAQQAHNDVDAAQSEAKVAGHALEVARTHLDTFVSGSYQQGSALGSVAAYLTSSSPENMLARAQLLEAYSGVELHALDEMRRARVDMANKDSAARSALDVASAKQADAQQAAANADDARARAVQAQLAQQQQTQHIEASKATVEAQLADAQSRVSGLQAQRQQYQDWLAAKQKEEQANIAAVANNSAINLAGQSNLMQTVIGRAMSQIGVPYAWGGGNAGSATQGIRDGGNADANGDYGKVGFDCSGLMIYAFAVAGVSLPHYTGYQYETGRKVPLSQRQPGDMLFWATAEAIHHVALYIGNEQMIEAPFSGTTVRISPVRYGGIMPFVVRVL
jgi:cell wall-associated NlpC family hydrolase